MMASMSSKMQTIGRSGSTWRNCLMLERKMFGFSQKKVTFPSSTMRAMIWWMSDDLPQPCLP